MSQFTLTPGATTMSKTANGSDLYDLDATVRRGKREINADIASGRVSASVATFSELHDHVDANWYGGAFNPEWEAEFGTDRHCAFWNRVQDTLSSWLANGRE